MSENFLAYVSRELSEKLRELQNTFPIISLTGPRQSGKTTLAKNAFPQYQYANLELTKTRELAENDPENFLLSLAKTGGIVDEAQRVPELFSVAQVLVDEDRSRKFIFTGSNNFLMMKSVSQSLAGRVALTKLLPFSLKELGELGKSATVDELIFRGGFPAAWQKNADLNVIFSSYLETYIERDLRQIEQIRNLRAYRNFVRFCANAVGNEFNASALGNAAGVDFKTAQSWLSILEASFVVFLLPPYFSNLQKRLVKRPKIYFCDTGLACWLLGIESPEQLANHPLRGNLFENFVVLEFFKRQFSQAKRCDQFYFYRDSAKREVDFVKESAGTLSLFEIKSSENFRSDFLTNLKYLQKKLGSQIANSSVIFTGTGGFSVDDIKILNFREL